MLNASRGCLIHPAIPFLLKKRRLAVLRRIGKSFSTPRRCLLSILGIVLACVWVGNALVSIVIREPLDPEMFQRAIPLGLLTYASWHVVRNAFRRPEVPIEWTPSEVEQLMGSPFSRVDRLVYRFATITNAVVIKALCFSILMLPDLSFWATGFYGALLGLLFVDLWKLLVEITAWGMTPRAYRFYRYGTAAVVGAFATSTLVLTFCTPNVWQFASTPAAFGILGEIFSSAASLRTTLVGQTFETPFLLFSNIVTASELSRTLGLLVLLGTAVVVSMFWLVYRVDCFASQLQQRLEQERYWSGIIETKIELQENTRLRLPRMIRLFGPGPLIWRQIKGAHNYRGSLFFALSVPAILACLPAFVYQSHFMIISNVVGALVFYSFILLPTALKFDFRRDLDRLVILKSLPLRPLIIVVGQLTTPVFIATTFQLFVLLLVSLFRPLPWEWIALSILLLLPLNVLIFAFENLIFLLYPYRIAQEGFAVFLRTTLTFTAKGLLFVLALVVMVAWAMSVGQLTQTINQAFQIACDQRMVFGIGVWLSIAAMSIFSILSVTRAFTQFDLSQDMPS